MNDFIVHPMVIKMNVNHLMKINSFIRFILKVTILKYVKLGSNFIQPVLLR